MAAGLYGKWGHGEKGLCSCLWRRSVEYGYIILQKPGQGFRAGGEKPQLGEGKKALGEFRNMEEGIEFPIGGGLKLREL